MRSSGRKARRHLCVCPLSGPSQNRTTPACALKPKALSCCACACVCIPMCACWCAHFTCMYTVCILHLCILVCVFLCACFCLFVWIWALFKLRVFNSSVWVCFYSDWCSVVKWVPALQQVSRNSVLPQLFFCLFIPDCWVTHLFIHRSVSVFLCRDCLGNQPEENKYQ